MINKGWNWNLTNEDVWLRPSEESIVMLYRWSSQGFRQILDIGCGKGRHTLLFAKNDFDTFGMDVSESAIESTLKLLLENGLKCDVKKADMRNIPFEKETFDAVFSYLTITHTDTKGVENTLNEIFRVLKPNGEVFFNINSSESGSFKNKKYPMIDENTIIKTEAGPEDGEPHFYATEEILYKFLEPFDIIWMNHTNNIFHNGKKNGSWDYYVLAKKK
jgi:ubiquinone/menaquinone biosynthesis C-methylase UbiE